MLWNCPHCNIKLKIVDEKVGTGWTFSRCCKCAGLGLIRKPEANVVKVDRVPPGESILLSEICDPAQATPSEIHKNSSIPIHDEARSPIIENQDYESFERAQSSQRRTMGAIITICAVITVISGMYLYVESQNGGEKDLPRTEQTAAVETESRKPNAVEAASTETLVDSTHAPATVAAVTPPLTEDHEVVDEVSNQAMAPVRPTVVSEKPELAPLIVRPNADDVEFRSQPGPDYEKIGKANSKQNYVVVNWSNQWFKVRIPGSTSDSTASTQEGWIRADQVEVVSSSTGSTTPNANPAVTE